MNSQQDYGAYEHDDFHEASDVAYDNTDLQDTHAHGQTFDEAETVEPDGAPSGGSSVLKKAIFIGLFGVVGLGYGAWQTGMFDAPTAKRASSNAFIQQQPIPNQAEMHNAGQMLDAVAPPPPAAPVNIAAVTPAPQPLPKVQTITPSPAPQPAIPQASVVPQTAAPLAVEPTIAAIGDGHINLLSEAFKVVQSDVQRHEIAINEIQTKVGKIAHLERRITELEGNPRNAITTGSVTETIAPSVATAPARNASTIAAPVAATDTQTTQKYVVQSGQSLSGIAHMHGLSTNQLLVLNPDIKNPEVIHRNQVIRLPAGAEAKYVYRPPHATKKVNRIAQRPTPQAQPRVPDWTLVAMSNNKAVIKDIDGRFYSVYEGAVIPGLGSIARIDASAQTVSTSQGVIR